MNEDSKMCLKILDEAIIFETEGIRFFSERQQVASAEMERRVFASLAKDEAGHKAYLMKMRNELAASNDPSTLSAENNEVHHSARRIFDEALQSVEGTDPYQADELEILQGALEVERRGYQMYSQAAAQVQAASARKVFTDLATQEQLHYQLLHNTIEYLRDPAGFNAFDESPLLDGG